MHCLINVVLRKELLIVYYINSIMLEFFYLIHLNIILLFLYRDSWVNLYLLEIKICDENMLFYW